MAVLEGNLVPEKFINKMLLLLIKKRIPMKMA
jgi:hypothetical protein